MAWKRGARYAPLLTASSFLVASAVGISRIIAAKHWASDVLAGMALGIGSGIILPFFILDDTKTVYVQADGFTVGMAW